MAKEHLLIIIDNKKIISPKKYTCSLSITEKEKFISESKKIYEKKQQKL